MRVNVCANSFAIFIFSLPQRAAFFLPYLHQSFPINMILPNSLDTFVSLKRLLLFLSSSEGKHVLQ